MRPVVIEAMQLDWSTWNEMCDFAGVGRIEDGKPTGGFAIPGVAGSFNDKQRTAEHVLALAIPTLEGVMVGNEGDWIIRGVKGEFYPCKPDIFEATYVALSGEDTQ